MVARTPFPILKAAEAANALAVANNDVAILAWVGEQKIPGCLGFAIYRTDLRSGTTVSLPAWVGFRGDTNAGWQPRTTEVWPVQKFSRKDLTAKRGGLYQYRILPMTGTPGDLKPAPAPVWETNPVHLTPENKTKNSEAPPDREEVFGLIRGAQQAVLFLAFQPGSPSIVDAAAEAQAANPALFVRGAVTDPKAANDFKTQLFHLSSGRRG